MDIARHECAPRSLEEMAKCEHHVAAGLQNFFHVASLWDIAEEEIARILWVDPGTVREWREELPRKVSENTMLRITLLLAIHKRLSRVLGNDKEKLYAWLREENSADIFAGDAPLSVIASGSAADMASVRDYLDFFGTW